MRRTRCPDPQSARVGPPQPLITPACAATTLGAAAEVRAQVIEERRRELFLEGHRLND
ncbi:MAG: hypothetical protein ACREON_15525 [Gemmatimonadaceae bacterium]